jgi:hypothetical protein
MSFINIPSVFTADPNAPLNPKNSFMSADPFAIVMEIQVDNSVIAEGLLFDAIWQIVNPRQDPYNYAWWTYDGSNVLPMPTVDVDWLGVNFQWGTDFFVWHWWSHYADAVSQIGGGLALQGVYYVQGTVSVEGSSLFANSGQSWFKVRP